MVPRLVVGQGSVGDLVAADRDGLGDGAVAALLGGGGAHFPLRYSVAVPRIPPSIHAVVVRGADDDVVPAAYTVPPDATGIEVVDVPGEDHFDLIDPSSAAWMAVVQRLTTL